tara:strand:+ start:53447 stop:53737 length:291 start_codon:yes stop_codon:yes gene_type:complete
MSQAQIRVFGSDKCKHCAKIIEFMNTIGWEHEYIDALADESQEICDKYDIDKLPHIQFLNEDGSIHSECVGVEELATKMNEVVKEISEQLGLNETK